MPDHDRQSFLDPELSIARRSAVIGIVGLSGGGSHIVQQLAHNGFENIILYDPKITEEKHRHRMVGLVHADIRQRVPKTLVGKRIIENVNTSPRVRSIQADWRTRPDPLKSCDLIFGAVDTFIARRDLESFARRYMIPLIDIGMSVDRLPDQSYRVGGQVLLSMPGRPCMWCLQFLRDELLSQQGRAYGDAGGQPQVVNVNALLAGAATWMGIDLLTAKTGHNLQVPFLSYDGNLNTLSEHPRWKYLKDHECSHYSSLDIGDPRPVLLTRRSSAAGVFPNHLDPSQN